MAGKNFDDKASRFQRNIYGGMKGRLRLQGLWQDLQQHVPPLFAGQPLSVWDAGGGLGQMSRRCAELGHRVQLNDLSAEMLAEAEQGLAEQPELLTRVNIHQQSIQDFASQHAGDFDVVICHAVLEWLPDAEAVVRLLADKLTCGGYLSLAFYNVNCALLMNVLKGNFNKALSGDFAGHPGSLTPPHPQQPEQVLGWLQQQGLEVLAKTGVRVAYDYLSRDLRSQRSDEDIIAVEALLRQQPAFWALGRYVHLIARKPSAG
jgi:S-adenosylmethionine-dependent methyltransferase